MYNRTKQWHFTFLGMLGVKTCPVLMSWLIFMSCLGFYLGPSLKTGLSGLRTVLHILQWDPMLSIHSCGWSGTIFMDVGLRQDISAYFVLNKMRIIDSYTNIQSHFTYTSTGTLSSRGNTAPSSFKSISRGSRSSMMVKAVRNTADRPEEGQEHIKK